MSVHPSIDVEALNALYDAHARDLLGYLARRSGDPQTALDLLSATFLAAFENRGRCRATDESGRVAWLYRIAANTFVDHVRRGASERRAINRLGNELRALTPAEVEVIEELAGSSELEARVMAAFGELSAQQREALWLHVVEELPYPEVSVALGLSANGLNSSATPIVQAGPAALWTLSLTPSPPGNYDNCTRMRSSSASTLAPAGRW